MQGSRSDFFQKSNKKQKHWDDGTGKTRQDNRKFNSGNQRRRNNQQESV